MINDSVKSEYVWKGNHATCDMEMEYSQMTGIFQEIFFFF